MSQAEQDDVCLRMGIKHSSDLQIASINDNYLAKILNLADSSLYDINELAKAYQKVPYNEWELVTGIAELTGKGNDVQQITDIANNFDSFIHIPNQCRQLKDEINLHKAIT